VATLTEYYSELQPHTANPAAKRLTHNTNNAPSTSITTRNSEKEQKKEPAFYTKAGSLWRRFSD